MRTSDGWRRRVVPGYDFSQITDFARFPQLRCADAISRDPAQARPCRAASSPGTSACSGPASAGWFRLPVGVLRRRSAWSCARWRSLERASPSTALLGGYHNFADGLAPPRSPDPVAADARHGPARRPPSVGGIGAHGRGVGRNRCNNSHPAMSFARQPPRRRRLRDPRIECLRPAGPGGRRRGSERARRCAACRTDFLRGAPVQHAHGAARAARSPMDSSSAIARTLSHISMPQRRFTSARRPVDRIGHQRAAEPLALHIRMHAHAADRLAKIARVHALAGHRIEAAGVAHADEHAELRSCAGERARDAWSRPARASRVDIVGVQAARSPRHPFGNSHERGRSSAPAGGWYDVARPSASSGAEVPTTAAAWSTSTSAPQRRGIHLHGRSHRRERRRCPPHGSAPARRPRPDRHPG